MKIHFRIGVTWYVVNLSSFWSQCYHPSPDPHLSHLDTSTWSPLFLTPPVHSPLAKWQFLQYKSHQTIQIWLFLAPKFSMTSPCPQHWDAAPSGADSYHLSSLISSSFSVNFSPSTILDPSQFFEHHALSHPSTSTLLPMSSRTFFSPG